MADELDPVLTPEQEPTLPAPLPPREPSKFKIVEDEDDTPTGFVDRFKLNVTENLSSGTLGTAQTGIQAVGRIVNDDPEMREYADYLLNQRALRRHRYEQTKWSETPLEWAGAFTGQMVGAAIDPLSYINALPGLGPVVGAVGGRFMGEVGQRIGTYALSQGIVNTAQDVANQGVETAAGVKPEYDASQTALAFGLGTVLGGAFGSLGEVYARYAKFRAVKDAGELDATMRELESDAAIAKQDLARAAEDDPTLRSDELNEITVTKTVPKEAAPDGVRTEAVPDAEGVRQPERVPEGAPADQGGVRADTAVGTAVPQARFGGDFYERPLSAQVSAPKVADDLGVDIPGTLLRELRGEPSSVVAWHGTPHTWAPERLVEMPDGSRQYIVGADGKLPDVPDGAKVLEDFPAGRARLDKVGTGEGAQAYGFGWYGAEAKRIGETYRDNLSGTSQNVYVDNVKIDQNSWAATAARNLEADAKFNGFDAAKQRALEDLQFRLEREQKLGANGRPAEVQEAIDLISRSTRESLAVRAESTGSLYQVRINANPDDFLDWDKPLSEQSERVRKALAAVGVQSSGKFLTGAEAKPFVDRLQAVIDGTELKIFPASEWLNGGMDLTAGRAALPAAKRTEWDAVFRDYGKATEPDGAEIYRSLAQANTTFGVNNSRMKDMASEALRDAGIPGLRYLDAGSRNAGDGTRNYVVFDDKLIQIIGKDGKAVPLNDYLKGQADAQFVEAIRAKPVTPELKADLTPPADAKSPAEQIVRAATTGNSAKFMDEAGWDTRTFYHGTNAEFDTFDITKSRTGNYGKGFYVSRIEKKASGYATGDGAQVQLLRIKRENSLDITNKQGQTVFDEAAASAGGKDKVHEELIRRGYDSIIAPGETVILKAENVRPWFEPPKTIGELEDAITKAANASAPEGMRVKAESVQQITEAVQARVAGSDPDIMRRTNTGGAAPPAGTQAVGAASTAPAAARELLSLQDMTLKLAADLDLPTFQGRVRGGKNVLGQFDLKQGVSRLRAITDFQTAVHEAAHAIEVRVGKPLMDLVQKHANELGPLDNTGKGNPREGFALLVEGDMTNPGYAAANAPQFTREFMDLMAQKAPKELRALEDAKAAWQAWTNAPKGDKVSSFVTEAQPRGVFDFLKGAKLPQAISLVMSKMTEKLTDDLDPVTQAVRELLRQARDASGKRMSLEGSANPENLVRLFPRSGQAGIRDLLDGVRPYRGVIPEGPSMRDALITATGQKGLLGSWDGARVQEFNDYLVLRRAASVYETKFNTKKIANRPVPMDEADVLAQIAEMEAINPNLRPASQMVHDYTRNLLKKMYNGGLIDAELYTTLSAEPFYVPMFRDMRDKPGAGGMGASPDGPGMTQLVKRMKGSDRNVIYPVQSLMTQTLLVNRTLQHNDIIKSFVSLSRAAQQAGATKTGKIIEEIPPSKIVGKAFNLQDAIKAAAKQNGIDPADAQLLSQSVADIFGKDPILGTMFRSEIAGKNGENIVFYKDGGELRAVRFINKDQGLALYEALTQMPTRTQDIALAIGQMSATALRVGVTTNPMFAFTNFIRDQMAAFILRKDYIPFDPRGLVSELRQDKYAQMYAYAGGVSPGAGAQGLSEVVDQHISALARKGWAVQKVGGLADLLQGKGMERVTGPLKAIGEFVQVAESGTRLNIMRTVYEQKLKQGLSEFDAMIEAASQARDILDFGRHGSGLEVIRKLVPFANAQAQGLSKGYRTMFEPLVRSIMGETLSKQDEEVLKNAGITLFKAFAVGGGLGYMYSLWAQKYRAYQDANEELRATHLILPGDAFGMPGRIIVVPKPFELALGFNIGEMVGLGIGAGDPRWAEMAMAGAYEVIMPANLIQGITAIKTPIELKLNKSLFTGRDIVPQKMQAYPADQQVLDNTSPLAKNIADILNAANRLVGKEPGWSPIKVDYAIGAQFSLWGRDAMALSSTVDPDKPAQSDYDQIFKRRFIKRADSSSETTKKFWEQAAAQSGKLAGAAGAYSELITAQKDKEAFEFLARQPKPQKVFTILAHAADENGKKVFTPEDRAVHPMVRAANANSILTGLIRELSKNSQRTYEDGTLIALNPDQRRDVIDNIRQLAAMEQFNALVIAKEKGYEGRKLEDTSAQLNVIRAHSPAAADEIATRYATGKIYTTKAIAEAWPQIEQRILTDAGQANIRDLTSDVVAEGYEFGADRVKKPAKRRIEIPRSVVPVQ